MTNPTRSSARVCALPHVLISPTTQLSWSGKAPEDVADFTLDIGVYLIDAADAVVSWAAVVNLASPQPSDLSIIATSGAFPDLSDLAAGLLTVWLQGGREGALYSVIYTITMVSGRVLRLAVGITVRTPAIGAIGFSPLALGAAGISIVGVSIVSSRLKVTLSDGTVIDAGPVVSGYQPVPVELVAAGGSAADATLLTSDVNVVIAAPSGSGVKFNSAFTRQEVIAPAGIQFIAYPADGAVFDGMNPGEGRQVTDTQVRVGTQIISGTKWVMP